MSDTAAAGANGTPSSAPVSEGGAGFLATKLGPLPLWVWGAAGLGLLLYLRMRSNTATATASPALSSSQIPEFINQTYTTVTPPTADPDPLITIDPPGKVPVVKPPAPKPGGGGSPADPNHMAAVNANRVAHKLAPYSPLQYQGVYGNAAQKANVLAHTPTIAAVNANRKAHRQRALTAKQYAASYTAPYNGGLWV